MISYKPLQDTLAKKNVTIQMLEDMLHHYDLRERLNSKVYISLKTVDKICNLLDCDITEVISWSKGKQQVTERAHSVFVILDWDKIIKLNSPRNLRLLSIEIGHKATYLTNLKYNKWVNEKVATMIAANLSTYTGKEISTDSLCLEKHEGRCPERFEKRKDSNN